MQSEITHIKLDPIHKVSIYHHWKPEKHNFLNNTKIHLIHPNYIIQKMKISEMVPILKNGWMGLIMADFHLRDAIFENPLISGFYPNVLLVDSV